MRAEVSKKALSDALGLLERVIPTRSSNPVLTAVHIQPTDTGLTLSGTNLEMDVRLQVPAQHALGSDLSPFTLPAHLFGQLVRTAPGVTVELERMGSQLSLRSLGSDVKLTVGDHEAYPPLTFTLPDEGAFTLDAAALLALVTPVVYAVSTDAIQSAFRGLRVEFTPKHARAVGSDGYRMAFVTAPPVPGAASHLLIPLRSVKELLRLLTGAGALTVAVHEHQFTVIGGPVAVNVKLMDVPYPDYSRVIPTTFPMTVTLDAAALRDSVNRVSVMSDKDSQHRLTVHAAQGRLTLSAEGQYGRARDTLDATLSGTADDMSLALNARYFEQALAGRTGAVTLHLSGSTSPVLVTDTHEPASHAVLVTMRE